jgi:hypothetical protein
MSPERLLKIIMNRDQEVPAVGSLSGRILEEILADVCENFLKETMHDRIESRHDDKSRLK